MGFRIEFSPDSIDHLGSLTAGERVLVIDAVERQLAHQPMVETRNRKPMRPNVLGAAFELRLHAHLRVYYSVDVAKGMVTVRGVGCKNRDRIRLGREWVKL